MRQNQGPPVDRRLTSCLCTQAQLESETFRWWTEQLHETHRLHRKLWEFCFIAQALYERGMLAPGKRGLGFAVGKEPLPALFASFGCEIVATDLDVAAASTLGWTDTNQHASQLDDLNGRGLCPAEEFRKRVSFRVADMNRIPADLKGFDFVWSSCAFEHLGTIRRGIHFIDRMAECLRPGGVAVHTTEYNLSSNYSTRRSGDQVIYRRCDVDKMIARLTQAGHSVEPLVLDRGNGEVDKIIDRPPYSEKAHLKLFLPAPCNWVFRQLFRILWLVWHPVEMGGWDSTSLGLIIQTGEKNQQAPPLASGARKSA